MTEERSTSLVPKIDRGRPSRQHQDDPPIRLAHVLFVLWVAGSVAWASFAANIALDQGWWVQRPELAAGLVLAPPILAHLLALFIIKLTNNPKLR